MLSIESALSSVVCGSSEKTYEKSLEVYRFRFELCRAYSQLPFDLIFDSIWKHRDRVSSPNPYLFPNCHLILRFANDAESDAVLASHSAGLRNRFCASVLQEFFDLGMSSLDGHFLLDASLVAHAANLGYIEEFTIRNHILQSLILYPSPDKRQVEALVILFRIAGATFGEYVDSSVIDRCFGVFGWWNNDSSSRSQRIQVRELR
jgi:hypothetical protein